MWSYLRSVLASLRGGFSGPTTSSVLLLWIVRGLFGVIVISVALATFSFLMTVNPDNFFASVLAFIAIIVVGLLIVLTDILLRHKQINTLSAIYFGLLLGLLLGNIFSSALDPFLFPTTGPEAQHPQILYQKRGLALMITAVCCYVTISTLLQTKDEFRFIIPYVEFSKQVKGGKPLVLDTSVIIDGRIADICDTRFIDTKLIVPRFVLQELQSVADSSDKLKRNRGRRGLDMLKRMQNNPKVELQMHEANLPELRDVHKVDERLVVLAKALGARVVTNDYNLNKIAQLQGVEVINLNELANALKSVALPGETDDGAAGQARRPDRPGRRLSGRRHDGGGGAGPIADRPGGAHHRDQRAADAGRPHDFRSDRKPPVHVGARSSEAEGIRSSPPTG